MIFTAEICKWIREIHRVAAYEQKAQAALEQLKLTALAQLDAAAAPPVGPIYAAHQRSIAACSMSCPPVRFLHDGRSIVFLGPPGVGIGEKAAKVWFSSWTEACPEGSRRFAASF